jgi:hypothetical protein
VRVEPEKPLCCSCGWSKDVNPRAAITMVVLDRERGERTAEVLLAIASLSTWMFAPGVSPPSRSASVRARELTLATGPLRDETVARVIVAPSAKGGIVVTFVLGKDHDITAASMNNGTTLLIFGKGWTEKPHAEEVAHADAIERVRAAIADVRRAS